MVEPTYPSRSANRNVRKAELKAFARTLTLVDGFALFIAVTVLPHDVTTLRDLVAGSIGRGRWLTPYRTDAGEPKSPGETWADLLFDQLTCSNSASTIGPVWLDASEAPAPSPTDQEGRDDAQWKKLFRRMNQARNLLAGGLRQPLVFITSRRLLRNFAEDAADFWSIRSETVYLPVPKWERRAERLFRGEAENLQVEQADWESRLSQAERLVTEARGRFTVQPEPAHLHALLSALNFHSQALTALGREAEALLVATEAVHLVRGMQISDPRFASTLGAALSALSDKQAATAQFDRALASAQESLAIYHGLAEGDSEQPEWQVNLMRAFVRIGSITMRLGKSSEAEAHFHYALGIAKNQVARYPSDRGWKRSLATCYSRIGDAQVSQGNSTSALESYQGALAICETLVRLEENDSWSQYALAIGHQGVGDAQFALRDLYSALESYRMAKIIWQRLASSSPTNVSWQNALASIYSRISIVHSAQGDFAEAIANSQYSFAISQELVANSPNDLRRQRNLAFHLRTRSDVESARGNFEGALISLRQCLAIHESLVSRYPDSAEWQSNLVGTLHRIARLSPQAVTVAEAIGHLERAHFIIEHLESENRLTRNQQQVKQRIERSLSELGGNVKVGTVPNETPVGSA